MLKRCDFNKGNYFKETNDVDCKDVAMFEEAGLTTMGADSWQGMRIALGSSRGRISALALLWLCLQLFALCSSDLCDTSPGFGERLHEEPKRTLQPCRVDSGYCCVDGS